MTIDSHCHLHDEKFLGDLGDVLQRAAENNITHMITIGCDIETTKKAKKLAESHENIYFSAGFHPHEAKDLTENALGQIKQLATSKKCVAIGECGLDYYYEHCTPKEQKLAFIRQLDLALLLDLPVIVHLRDAFSDCLSILKDKKYSKLKVVIHCFSGTIEEARIFSKLGFYLSLSGIITFKRPGDLPMVAKEIPLEQLLIETDCPYLAPIPYRGKRNEPSFIRYTLRAVAKAREEDEDYVAQNIHQNTLRFFGLS